MMNTQPKSDRITRGVALMLSGAVRSYRSLWIVRSASSDREYLCGDHHCDCRDNQNGHICKHIWASSAYVAAAIIVCFRQTTSLMELRAFGRAFADYLTSHYTAPGVIATARDEYRLALARLRAAAPLPPAPAPAALPPQFQLPEAA